MARLGEVSEVESLWSDFFAGKIADLKPDHRTVVFRNTTGVYVLMSSECEENVGPPGTRRCLTSRSHKLIGPNQSIQWNFLG